MPKLPGIGERKKGQKFKEEENNNECEWIFLYYMLIIHKNTDCILHALQFIIWNNKFALKILHLNISTAARQVHFFFN